MSVPLHLQIFQHSSSPLRQFTAQVNEKSQINCQENTKSNKDYINSFLAANICIFISQWDKSHACTFEALQSCFYSANLKLRLKMKARALKDLHYKHESLSECNLKEFPNIMLQISNSTVNP